MNVLYGQNKAQKHVTVHAVQIGEEMSVEVSVVSCRAAIIRNPH